MLRNKKELIMPKKLICVVYVESDNIIGYWVIKDPSIIDDVLTVDTNSLSITEDVNFPVSLSNFLNTEEGSIDFPSYEYQNTENVIVRTVYF